MQPSEVFAVLRDELERAADRARVRGSALGRRGDLRRAAAARPQDGRARARRRAPIATTASTASIRCGCSSATSRPRPPSNVLPWSRSRQLPSGSSRWGTRWTPPTCTRGPAGTRSSSRRCSRQAQPGCRRPCGTPSSRAHRGLSDAGARGARDRRPRPAARRALAARGRARRRHGGTSTSASRAGLVTADDDAVAFRHELARAAVEDAMPPTRRLGLQRRILARSHGADAGEIDPARLAHHAEAAGDVDAVLEFARRGRRAGGLDRGLPGGGSAVRARPPGRRAGALQPARRAELLEGRSRACYLADDQLEAIAVVREAIACRQRGGRAGARGPRPHGAQRRTSSAAGCSATPEAAMDEATTADRRARGERRGRVRRRVSVVTRLARRRSRRRPSSSHWRAREMALARRRPPGPPSNALVTIGTIELRRDPAVGRAILLEGHRRGARAAGFSEQVARALNNLGGFGATAPNHELADTYLPQALEYCVAHNEDLWRINALAIAARNALDRGRWTEAADFAGASPAGPTRVAVAAPRGARRPRARAGPPWRPGRDGRARRGGGRRRAARRCRRPRRPRGGARRGRLARAATGRRRRGDGARCSRRPSSEETPNPSAPARLLAPARRARRDASASGADGPVCARARRRVGASCGGEWTRASLPV